jgi:hypothetical protein
MSVGLLPPRSIPPLWKLIKGRWLMVFHQGTPTGVPADMVDGEHGEAR